MMACPASRGSTPLATQASVPFFSFRPSLPSALIVFVKTRTSTHSKCEARGRLTTNVEMNKLICQSCLRLAHTLRARHSRQLLPTRGCPDPVPRHIASSRHIASLPKLTCLAAPSLTHPCFNVACLHSGKHSESGVSGKGPRKASDRVPRTMGSPSQLE